MYCDKCFHKYHRCMSKDDKAILQYIRFSKKILKVDNNSVLYGSKEETVMVRYLQDDKFRIWPIHNFSCPFHSEIYMG